MTKYKVPVHITLTDSLHESTTVLKQLINESLTVTVQYGVIYWHLCSIVTRENVLGTLFHSECRSTCMLDYLSVTIKRRANTVWHYESDHVTKSLR